MASGVKLCAVCGDNEAVRNCDVCAVALCDICTKEVVIPDMTPGTQVRPGVSMSPLRPAETKKKVCPKCLREADFL